MYSIHYVKRQAYMVPVGILRLMWLLACGVLLSYGAWTQEDVDIGDIEDLFADIPQDSSSDTQDQGDENASEFDIVESERNALEIRGEHAFVFPFLLYSAFEDESEYFNYNEYPRAPQQRNVLGLEYTTPSISAVTEVNIDFYGISVDNIQELIQASFGETYISVHTASFDFIAGLKNYSWGTAVGFNPTDNLNPFDYRSGIMPEKIPLLSMAMKFYPLSIMSAEIVLAPVYQPFKTGFIADELSLLREELSRTMSATLPAPAETIVSAQPEDPFSQIQLGGKLNLFLSFADMSFSYLYDMDDFYSLDERMLRLTDTPEVEVDLLRRRIHRVGFDIIGSIQSVGLWAEVAANIAEDSNASEYSKIRNHNIAWTVGTDVSFGNTNTFRVVLQQLGRYIFDYPTSAVDTTDIEDQNERMNYALARQTEGLSLGGMVDLSLSLFGDRILPAVRAVYTYPLLYDDSETTRFGTLIMVPSLEVTPIDSFSIILGTEFAYAWEDDYHINEQSTRNNRVFIEVAYKWSGP